MPCRDTAILSTLPASNSMATLFPVTQPEGTSSSRSYDTSPQPRCWTLLCPAVLAFAEHGLGQHAPGDAAVDHAYRRLHSHRAHRLLERLQRAQPAWRPRLRGARGQPVAVVGVAQVQAAAGLFAGFFETLAICGSAEHAMPYARSATGW